MVFMKMMKRNSLFLIWLAGYAGSIELGIFFMQIFILFGVVLLFLSWRKGNLKTPPHHPSLIPVIVFGTALILSAVLSEHPFASIQRIFRNYAFATLGFITIIVLVDKEKQRLIAVKSLLIFGTFGGLNAIFQYFTGIDPIYNQPIQHFVNINQMSFYTPVGLLNQPLTFSGVQLIIFLFCMPYLWNKRVDNIKIYMLFEMIIFVSILLTMRRAVLLGVVIAGGLYLITRSKRAAIVTISTTALLFIMAFFYLPGFETRAIKIVESKGDSENERVALWKTAIEIGVDNPIVGVGPGNWSENAAKRLPKELLYGHPHNDTLNIFAISGGLGLVSFLVFYFSIFSTWWREKKFLNKNPSSYDLYLGGILAIFGLSIAAQFQCFMIDGESLIALGVVMGLAISARNQLKSENSRVVLK